MAAQLPVSQRELHDKITSAVDASEFFKGSVGKAIEHYKKNPAEHVKIFSNSKQQWYVNSMNKPNEFRGILFVPSDFSGKLPAAQLSAAQLSAQSPGPQLSPAARLAQLSAAQLPAAQPSLSDKHIFVFDFDETLTVIHTGGSPDTMTEYFSMLQKEKVKRMFEKIKSNFSDSVIVILSRGYKNKINTYMEQKCAALYGFVDKIIGTEDGRPLTGAEADWADWKVKELQELSRIYNTKHIIFFDDTKINIDRAKATGFEESYLVEKLDKNTTTVATAFENYLKKVQSGTMRMSGGKYYMTAKETYKNLKKKITAPIISDRKGEIYVFSECRQS